MTADLHHLAAAYTLDALEPDERDAFERHLASCELCRTEVAEFGATAAVLGEAAAVPPPPGLRDRVLAEVHETRQLPPVPGASAPVVDMAERRRSRLVPLLAAVAAIVLVAIGAVVVISQRSSDPFDDLVAAPDAVVTLLPATGEQGATATVEVVWSAERRQVALRADGLAATTDGLVYELWAIEDGAAISAGLFRPRGGSVRQVEDLDDVDGPDAWGITIEPEGGSVEPTGDVLFYADSV